MSNKRFKQIFFNSGQNAINKMAEIEEHEMELPELSHFVAG